MSVSTFILPAGRKGAVATADVTPQPTFLDYVRPDLVAVEERMNSELGSDVRTVCALTRHVLEAGGKRLRPAMVALSARAIEPELPNDRIATVGASVEFVHMATLVHDDVVDNTSTRRGKPTANAVFGNGVAVLSGDYILARAMRLLAIDGDLRIIRTVSDITVEMSEGEVLEIGATGRADLALGEYMEILRKKTAIFVEGCCRCGAILGGAGAEAEAALATYGYHLGMAFQLADDLLDYTGDPTITGKPHGSDLRDGRATLPFLIALERSTAEERRLLYVAFGAVRLSEADLVSVCEILSRHGAFDRTRAVALEHVEQAAFALTALPRTTARECFESLTDFVVARDR